MTCHERDFLIVAPDRWDEACFAVPAVRALIASGLACGVACHDHQGAFWNTLPGLQVLAFPPKSKTRWLASQLGPHWKAALIWEFNHLVNAIKPAGIQKRLGPNLPPLRKILTHTLTCAVHPTDHRVRFYLAAAEELGTHTHNPDFFAPVDAGSSVREKTILLCPDSDFGQSHEWIPSGWLEISNCLIEAGFRVTVVGLEGGRGLGKRLAADLGGQAGWLDASDLGGVLPRLAEHRFCVAADGSLPHVAAHMGGTCVTLFGPGDSAWKRPLGRRHAMVRRHVECAPCFLPKCPLDRRCQNELTAKEVWHAISGILLMDS